MQVSSINDFSRSVYAFETLRYASDDESEAPQSVNTDSQSTVCNLPLSTFATRESHRDVTALKMSIVVIVISQVTRICRSRASRWCRSKTCR